MNTSQPLVIISGPTAVGKTKISIELAKKIGGEIISADSMQVYQHMDIGSAKITKEQMQGIPHHLIDFLPPTQPFNVALFQKLTKESILGIYSRGKIPIIVGGTGFYIQAVLYEVDFTENNDENDIRKELEALADEKGNSYLHKLLFEIDQESASFIHENNRKRVIRAIEYFKLTGEKISLHNAVQKEKNSPYQFHYFVLTDHRENLYKNINNRVDWMMENGLLEEVILLKNMGCKRDSVAMQGLGYKEIFKYLEGECTLEEAVNEIKQSTRHFAKRQLTWFKRETDVLWIPKYEYDYDDLKIVNTMARRITNGVD